MAFDPYGFTSGLIDDFDFTVTESEFRVNSKIDKTGETLFLALQGKTSDSDQPVLDEESALHLSCGKKFVTEDGGKTSAHESGDLKPYAKASYISEFLLAAVELDSRVRTEINPYDAASWVGSKWHLKRVNKAYDVDGNKGTSSKLMPVAYLGKAEAGTVEVASSRSATSAPASNGGIDGLLNGDSQNATVVASLTTAAKEAVDVDAFQAVALTIDGISDELQVQLVDSEFAGQVYVALKG